MTHSLSLRANLNRKGNRPIVPVNK
jgi:hypothetical protein